MALVVAVAAAVVLGSVGVATRAGLTFDALAPAGTLTPETLAQTLAAPGGGVTISNVVFTGVDRGAGTFAGGTGLIGFEDGVVLGSGGIAGAVGPNNSPNFTDDMALAGDTDLDGLIPGYVTHDATVLEFDFVPLGYKVTFEYVFTSEEYNEYVNSPFNDVFGFFVNGVNYALLPDGVTPVSINNVNNGDPGGDPTPSNPSFYIDNDPFNPSGAPYANLNVQADGLTVVLTFTAPVNAYVTNHMKLAIADAGDHVLDSWVFIKAGSFEVAEICNNEIDDDEDGATDKDDPDCWKCVDGYLDPNEQCDDGNDVDGDHCSNQCVIQNQDPVCASAVADPAVLWPPNHAMTGTSIIGVVAQRQPEDARRWPRLHHPVHRQRWRLGRNLRRGREGLRASRRGAPDLR